MPLHDYKCRNCGDVLLDQLESPTQECISCGDVSYEITYSHWKTVGVGEDLSALEDRFGRRKAFTAGEDPTCAIELGLASDNGSGVRTFTPEQQSNYLQKIMKDGDSPKLRREILRQRADNNKAAGAPDSYETM